jgi:CheY-like chemotaxis protein
MLAGEIAANDRLNRRLEMALQAVWRGSKLASQLLAFARRQPLSPKVVNLGRLIRNADDMLSELGYSVLTTRNADDALVIIDSGVAIDLLFTDIVMPGTLRTPELALKARQKLAGVTVLFTSGYADNLVTHGGRLDQEINLISKPYIREKSR